MTGIEFYCKKREKQDLVFRARLCYNTSPLTRWSSGVVVNMSPCHGEDRGFESHLDRQNIFL